MKITANPVTKTDSFKSKKISKNNNLESGAIEMARPKNPTTIKLERKIAKLEEEIEELKKVSTIDENSLTEKGFAVILNQDDKHYYLLDIRFNKETGDGKVVGQKRLSDARYRVDYELRKMFAHGEIINE